MRVNFVLSEVATGLRRNLTMTVAMILTTAISLGLMGTGLLIANMISDMKEIYYDKVQVSIFLADDVTEEQRADIESRLEASPEVKSYLYESKEEAYERFQEQFSQQPELVENTPADALPESFRVELVNPERYPVIAEQFPNGENGVDRVRHRPARGGGGAGGGGVFADPKHNPAGGFHPPQRDQHHAAGRRLALVH